MKMRSLLLMIFLFWTLLVPFSSVSLAVNSPSENTNKNFLQNIEFDSSLVTKWFNYYTRSGRARFQRHLHRGEKYRTLIESILISYGLPIELYYVGLIESGYVLKAKSHQSAEGPWQFIKSTGKSYGLRVDSEVDERLNIYMATHAAAKYLGDLYNIFNSWALSIAAYNAGEYRIMSAIRKGNTRSFNKLIQKKLLPKETSNYVSKFWTAMMLDRYSDEFNFYKKKNTVKLDHLNLKIELKKNYSISELIEMSGLSSKDFYTYNQHLKSKRVRASKKRPVSLYLPQASFIDFANQIDVIDNAKIVKVKNPKVLKKYGFNNLITGEKLKMIKLSKGRVRIKRLKNGQTIDILPPKI
jgi:membrane-bound lytic murein transglycosylase D